MVKKVVMDENEAGRSDVPLIQFIKQRIAMPQSLSKKFSAERSTGCCSELDTFVPN